MRDLRAVGQRRAFELTEGEEPPGEHRQPPPDLGQRIGRPLVGRQARRPVTAIRVVPGVPGQERDLGRPGPVAQDLEQGEVLQRVGADGGLAALHLFAVAGRHQLRGDLGVQHRLQRLADLAVELPGVDHPPDQMLDQGFRHTGVDVVVAHLVADPVGRPPQRQLGEVAGAEHDPAALVGDPEEIVGAQASLHVLEGDVVELLAPRIRMTHLGEHQLRGWPDVDLVEGDPQRLRQPDGVVLGPLAGGEAGQRVGQDVAARAALPVHGLGGDDERVGGVQTAGDPDDDLGVVQGAQPLLQSGHLNVVGLVAVQLQSGRIAGHERKPLHLAPQSDVASRRVELELDAPEGLQRSAVVAAVVVEGPHPQPLGAQQAQVDVGDRPPVARREPLGLRQQNAVLVDHGLAVPGQIGGRLALAGGGVDIGSQAAGRRRAGEQFAVLGAADGDRAAGQVGQHGGTGQGRLRTGRYRHEHVLADLDVQDQTGQILGGEEQIRPERHVGAEQPDRCADVITRGHLPAFVELPVGRQVGLGRHPEHAAAVDDHRAVVDPVQPAQRRADDEHRQQVNRFRDDPGERVLDRAEQAVLQQDVLDRIPGQGQFREDRDRHRVVVAVPGDPQHRLGVGRGIGQHGGVRAGRHPREAVSVGREEVHAS